MVFIFSYKFCMMSVVQKMQMRFLGKYERIEDKNMKNNMMNKLKRVVATMMLACMLLTVTSVGVSSDAGIMVCGESVEHKTELK